MERLGTFLYQNPAFFFAVLLVVALGAAWVLKRFKKIVISVVVGALLMAAGYSAWLYYKGQNPGADLTEKAGITDGTLESFRTESRQRLDDVTGRLDDLEENEEEKTHDE